MPPPVYTVGQVLAASDVNNWFLPVVAYKTGDTSRASTTTNSPDPDLTLPVVANANYFLEAFLFFEGSATASQGIKWTWIVPTGATMRYHLICADTAGVAFSGTGATFTGSSTGVSGSTGSGNLRGLSMKGTLFVGSTAGNAQITWSPNVNEAAVVTLHAQSSVMLTRIG
jgi:hypothetical protein